MKGHFRGDSCEQSAGDCQGHLGAEKAALCGPKAAFMRSPEAIPAGLPADVMDECVEDLAEAVVAMLLSQAAIEPDEDEHASGHLRKV
jgi:hypothetical protein